MVEVLRERIIDNKKIIEYTRDGINVSHTVEIGLVSDDIKNKKRIEYNNTIDVLKKEVEKLKIENETLKEVINTINLNTKNN